MQESWTFHIDPLNKGTFEDVIKATLKKEEKDLGIFLSFYFRKEGAIAEKTILKDSPVFETEKSGNLILEFDLVHFNACLAIHEQKREQMTIDFFMDQIESKLTLKGPYWPERGVDEI
ncbi:hypothetical protein JYB64_06555 [Algoriphagus aestuarii]|nr:hypothetical protein [Algoriphagus aestuarii]